MDYHFKSQLLKWKITAVKNRAKAIKEIKKMITDDMEEENRAAVDFVLFHLTHEETYRKEAIKLLTALYETAPKIIYKETMDILNSEK